MGVHSEDMTFLAANILTSSSLNYSELGAATVVSSPRAQGLLLPGRRYHLSGTVQVPG